MTASWNRFNNFRSMIAYLTFFFFRIFTPATGFQIFPTNVVDPALPLNPTLFVISFSFYTAINFRTEADSPVLRKDILYLCVFDLLMPF